MPSSDLIRGSGVGILGMIVGPIVFWIERRGGEVRLRRSALFGASAGPRSAALSIWRAGW